MTPAMLMHTHAIFVAVSFSCSSTAESISVKPLEVLLMTVFEETEVPLPHEMQSEALKA
jgi:hypothetical protein